MNDLIKRLKAIQSLSAAINALANIEEDREGYMALESIRDAINELGPDAKFRLTSLLIYS